MKMCIACLVCALAGCARRPAGAGDAGPAVATSAPAVATSTATTSEAPSDEIPVGPPTMPLSKHGLALATCTELAKGDDAVRHTCLGVAKRHPRLLKACLECRGGDAGACETECRPLIAPAPTK